MLATKKTNPRPIIGGYAAAALEELRAFSGVSPGPAAYHVPRSMTRQLQAGKKTPPARSFGTAARFGGGGIRRGKGGEHEGLRPLRGPEPGRNSRVPPGRRPRHPEDGEDGRNFVWRPYTYTLAHSLTLTD